MNNDETEKRTWEALADVDAGQVIDHQLVEDWAASLSADVPLPVPRLNQVSVLEAESWHLQAIEAGIEAADAGKLTDLAAVKAKWASRAENRNN